MGVDAVLVLGVRHHKQLVRCRRLPPAPGGIQRRKGLGERLEVTAQVQPAERHARVLQDVGVLLLWKTRHRVHHESLGRRRVVPQERGAHRERVQDEQLPTDQFFSLRAVTHQAVSGAWENGNPGATQGSCMSWRHHAPMRDATHDDVECTLMKEPHLRQ